MSKSENPILSEEKILSPATETEQERRAQLVSRYIEKIIESNKSASEEELREIRKHYAETKSSSKAKAEVLYEKLMAYTADKQAESGRRKEAEQQGIEFEPEEADPYLISDIRVLFEDEETRKVFSEAYGQARIDAKKQRLSELGDLWNTTSQEIIQKEEEYKQLEQDINLAKIAGQGKISSAKSRMVRLAARLNFLEKRKNELEQLDGFPSISENTDAVANFQYETLVSYKKQLKEGGFIWLSTRKRIHKETVSAILNHRWPVLTGEAGSGKSDQADAAAMELTGYPPTEVECESNTGEKQLIKDIAVDPETGGSYEIYGPLMQAFTGYEDSRQKEPKYKTGRIARFDESGRLGPKAYAIIKKARQKKPGEDFYGHPVLPGAEAIWTTNPVGPRYPDRHAPDPAMRRELADVANPYPEMSPKNPELYDFMVTTLFDENNYITAAKEELAPVYDRKDIAEDKREILKDGSIIIGKNELVGDISDSRHGALWRFAGAIKALQESFAYGNAETESYPDTILRYKEDSNGNIEITKDGTGTPLTLSTSTVTLGELDSWMSGFNERMSRQDKEFHVSTLTEWLDFKIKTYLKQADKADKAKIEAIFKSFHFLENQVPDLSHAKPLTPKEIGYLSPRVPRPVYLQKPQKEEETENKDKGLTNQNLEKEYTTKTIVLENGRSVIIKEGGFSLMGIGGKTIDVSSGSKMMINGHRLSLTGTIDEKDNEQNGEPVGLLLDEDGLYQIISTKDIEFGLYREFNYSFQQELVSLAAETDEYCLLPETGQETKPQPKKKKRHFSFT